MESRPPARQNLDPLHGNLQTASQGALCQNNAMLMCARYIDSRAENGLTALHLAAVNGSLECVRLLLDGGASMMVRTVDLDVVSDVGAPAGSHPLHVAAMTGHVAILQAMLQVFVNLHAHSQHVHLPLAALQAGTRADCVWSSLVLQHHIASPNSIVSCQPACWV